MARTSSPARLVIALSVAALLAVFLLYTSIAGGGTPSLSPSELEGRKGVVSLAGEVVGKPRGDARGSGLRFRVRDIEGGRASVLVVYRCSVPDIFETGRHVLVKGQLRNGVFVAERDTLMTKCPSKYTPKD